MEPGRRHGAPITPAEARRPPPTSSAVIKTTSARYIFGDPACARPFVAATAGGHLLDQGTLYVARFDPDGTGRWLKLAHGQNGLTAEHGFRDQAEVLVNARAAADLVGATKMDRPEWGAVDPRTGLVYFTLTNNTRRTEGQVDGANPRAGNSFGHIVRWSEDGNDHAAMRFKWEIFVLAGDPAASRARAGRPLTADSIFACPDGLWFDADGRMWIQTDMAKATSTRASTRSSAITRCWRPTRRPAKSAAS